MDFDRTSNCSGISNQSDDIKSTVSSLSAVSAYGDEFAELRHLVHPDKYSAPAPDCSTPVYNDSGCDIHYEDRIADLSLQLQSTLKLNKKYKNDLFNLEKNIELRYHDKFQTLLKANRQLNIELITAKDQLERLFKRFTTATEPSSTCDKYFVQLEQKCHELSSYNTQLQGKLQEINVEKNELEVANKRLKIDFQDCKIYNETKNACIKELKEKISNQFIEIQALLKSRNMNENALKDVRFELQHSSKSLEWYKNQLAITQRDKKVLLEDLTKCKSEIIKQEENQNSMNLTVKCWQNKFENLRLDSLKEKERLFHQIKNLNLKNDTNFLKDEKTTVLGANTDKALLNYYETSIQDLQKEILIIKEELNENDKVIRKINKENSNLSSHCVILQKTMQQKDITIDEFNSVKNQLNMELCLLKEQDYKKSQEILELKTNLANLKTELLIKKEEKEAVENTVHVIRQQFFAFKSQYDKLKKDLVDKNKQILNLQNENQHLFMNNNLKICELEEAKEKDFYIEKLKIEINVKEQKIVECLNQIKVFQVNLREKDQLNSILCEEKNRISKEYKAEIQRYEDVVIKYRKTVQDSENQISNLKQLKNENEETIKSLQNEIKEKDKEILEMKKYIHLNNFNITTLEPTKLISNNLEKFEETASIKLYEIKNNVQIEQNILESQKKYPLHEKLNSKISVLEARIKYLNNKAEDFSKIYNFQNPTLSDVKDEEIKELKVLLQVKHLELKEKQKKYERNYHTLLRKVKEHMKGRSSAEKQNKYLQELYNNLCDENNSLKLALSVKENEQEHEKILLNNHVDANEKLKEKLLHIERDIRKTEICLKCLEYDAVNQRLLNMEEFAKKLENEKKMIQDLVLAKENANLLLQQEIQELQLKIAYSNTEKDTFACKAETNAAEKEELLKEKNTLEEKLIDLQSSYFETNKLFENEKQENLTKTSQNSLLNEQIKNLDDQLQCASKELEIMNSALQNKSEELEFLDKEKSKKLMEYQKQIEEYEITVSDLKNQLHELQIELNTTQSDKYFLQRLCNDIKLALKSHINFNKVLKERLGYLSKEKQDFNSLPNTLSDFSVSEKYNETYIEHLLRQQKTPFQDKPFSDIQISLDGLRKEITVLQEHISKKNQIQL